MLVMSRQMRVALVIVFLLVLVGAGFIYWFLPEIGLSSSPSDNPSENAQQCEGTSACFTGWVAYIVDGDTLDVGSTRIRLALVNTPEAGQAGYQEAKDFTVQTCPIGTQALVDEDDGQTAGSYGRTIAVVYCGGENLNEALLKSGHAEARTYYCSVSEFANEARTKRSSTECCTAKSPGF